MLHFHTRRISLNNQSHFKMGFKKFGRGEEAGARKPCQCAEPKPLLNSSSTMAPPRYANSGPEFGKKNNLLFHTLKESSKTNYAAFL